SYNKDKPSIGKFGMGFFSILYWIFENGFDRSLLIESSYLDNDKIKSFKARLFFTEEDGLCMDYEDVFNTGQSTGVKITIDCSYDNFTYYDIEGFRNQINKMSMNEDAVITVNENLINENSMNFDNIIEI